MVVALEVVDRLAVALAAVAVTNTTAAVHGRI
jgi:hypothetical protein